MPTKKKHKKGISVERALRIQRELESRIRGVFGLALITTCTHEALMEHIIHKVWRTKEWSLAPRYVRTYISGMQVVLMDNLYHYHVEWVLSLDGKLVSREDVEHVTIREDQDNYHKYALTEFAEKKDYTPVGYRSPWQRVDPTKSTFVWKHPDTGAILYDRPFHNRGR